MDAREAIASAVVDLVAAGGLEAVSVRTAAARAGVSPGLVQHHYGTKQALLVAAMHLVGQRVRARLASPEADHDAARDLGQDLAPDDPARRLRLLAEQLLPLDDRRRTEGRVWLAFVARAAVDDQVAAVHAREWSALQDTLARLLASRRTKRPVAPEARDVDDAARLLAALDGMAVAALTEPVRMDRARMTRLLDQLLA